MTQMMSGHGIVSQALRETGFEANAALQEATEQPLGRPRGDGSFAASVAGAAPQPELDLQFALMSEDSYAPAGSDARNGQIRAELEAAGWYRLESNGDGQLVDAEGHSIPIPPQMLHDEASGFDAAIYRNAQGHHVIAYRGTDSWGVGRGGDLLDNLGQGLGIDTAQYSRAVDLATMAHKVFGEGNVAITGHSLGGGLASAAMVATGMPGVTFNAAGLSDDSIRKFGLSPNAVRDQLADSGQIRRYVVDGDILTAAQQDIPAIPVPVSGVGVLPFSPPNAVGHELRIAAPVGVDTPWGAHSAYVDALRQNTAYHPSDRNGLVGLWSSGLERIGELSTNLAGTLIDAGIQIGTSVRNDFDANIAQINAVIDGPIANGDVISGVGMIAGDMVDGTADLVGHVVTTGADATGDAIDEVATTVGGLLRDLGKRMEWAQGAYEAVATGVEWLGQTANTVVDKAGEGVGWVLDKGGDVIERAADAIGDAGQWVGDRVSDGVQAVTDAVGDVVDSIGDGLKKLFKW